MKRYQCQCGNPLFFHSFHCVECRRKTVMCPVCRQITGVDVDSDEASFRCGNAKCRSELVQCDNAKQYDVCNRGVRAGADLRCEFCRLNSVVPDWTDESNRDKWRRLEFAKHRVLHVLQELRFPLDHDPAAKVGPLRFEFKSDALEPVPTGHTDGCITINVKEADTIEREKTRVAFSEPHRTLVGHFRHELGHYYWDRLVAPRRIDDFRALFGDERTPTYADAQQQYYQNGPCDNWQPRFVSGYATMHPWEDFAESFGAYLDLVAVLRTCYYFGFTDQWLGEFPVMLDRYREVGVFANELNRDMGLLDLVPEVFTEVVAAKIEFIHSLPST